MTVKKSFSLEPRIWLNTFIPNSNIFQISFKSKLNKRFYDYRSKFWNVILGTFHWEMGLKFTPKCFLLLSYCVFWKFPMFITWATSTQIRFLKPKIVFSPQCEALMQWLEESRILTWKARGKCAISSIFKKTLHKHRDKTALIIVLAKPCYFENSRYISKKYVLSKR